MIKLNTYKKQALLRVGLTLMSIISNECGCAGPVVPKKGTHDITAYRAPEVGVSGIGSSVFTSRADRVHSEYSTCTQPVASGTSYASSIPTGWQRWRSREPANQRPTYSMQGEDPRTVKTVYKTSRDVRYPQEQVPCALESPSTESVASNVSSGLPITYSRTQQENPVSQSVHEVDGVCVPDGSCC